MNSALNPEAPEFYPHLASVTKAWLFHFLFKCSVETALENSLRRKMDDLDMDGFTTVYNTIKNSNLLPMGTSYDLFKTFTDFSIVTTQLSENVLEQSNLIVATELPAVKLKRHEDEYTTEKIIDANDSMLDRVNINIDTVTGVNKVNETFLEGVASWNRNNNKPEIAKIQMGSTMFLGAKNIPRPQVTFKDTIDNSDSLWVPKISDKPNNIKPLALNILYNEEGEAVGYEHPYQVELDLYRPPSEFLEPDASPPTFPPPLADTPLTMVATEAALDDLVKHLDGVKEMAVDVEHHSYRTYQGITCLIQITTSEGGDFIIDALAVREHVHKLNQAFTDPRKIKVFHGAELDVLWLQRDFGVYIVGLFDTYQAARALNANGLSLKYLLMKYCGVNADKKYQLADWRIRPLPAELVEYARQDTHYLLYIWRRMKAELLEEGPNLLPSVIENSRQICGQTYKKEVVDESSHMRLYLRSKKSFNSQQMAALQLLYKWRDAHARELDESTMYLLPNHMLLSLAESLPREVQGVNACCNPMPPFVKQNIITIHRMILSCRELPLEPQLYQMPASIRSMAHGQPTHAHNVHDLAHLPDFREDQINLNKAAILLEEFPNFQPDIPAFIPPYASKTYAIVSDLNVDAKQFIPPYDRYRKYRSLAQMEELKEFKDKEAKIAAISKGNELIKQEVLVKIQQAKSKVENQDTTNAEPIVINLDKEDNVINNTEKRKRKISSDKHLIDDKETVKKITDKIAKNEKLAKNEKHNVKTKQFSYKNVNYRKFFDESDKAHKHPKMKFKKHK